MTYPITDFEYKDLDWLQNLIGSCLACETDDPCPKGWEDEDGKKQCRIGCCLYSTYGV